MAPEPPLGWGATGAPNDGFHQFYHGLRRAAMRTSVGMGQTMRKALADISLSVDGKPRFE